MDCKVLNKKDSTFYRELVIEQFINTDSDIYKKRILNKTKFSDGFHTSGYLWDCLNNFNHVTEKELKERLLEFKIFYVMADDHSRDLIKNAKLWPFDKESVAVFEHDKFWQNINDLPEDLYIFTEKVNFLLIITHEDDGKRRICYYIKK